MLIRSGLIRTFVLFTLLLPLSSLIGQDSATVDTTSFDSLVADTSRIPDSLKNITEIKDEFLEEDKQASNTFSLKSPHNTLWSLLHFTGDKDYHPDSAALTLFMSEKDRKGGKDIELAIHLKQYLDGGGHYIYLDEVPTDPNYADSSGKHMYYPVTGVPEIYMYKRGNSWFFSSKTVSSIPSLYEKVYPFGTLEFIPAWSKPTLLGLEIWKWLGILIFLVLAVVLQKLFTFILGNIIEVITNKILRTDLDDKLFDGLARPISLFFISFLLVYFTPLLQFPIDLNKWVMLSLRIAQPVFVVVIAYKVVDVFRAFFVLRAEKTASKMDDQLVPLAAKAAKAIVLIAGGVVVLQYLEVNITALLAGISIGGIALAFAAQDTIANFFGSVMIFVDQPFVVGDWIIAGDIEGTVEEVGIRSTRIRTFENSIVSVPNGQLADMAIDNKGLRKVRRFKTTVGLTYDTPPALMEAYVDGLRKIIDEHPATFKNYEIHFNSMGDFSLNILIYIFFEVPTWTEELMARQEILLAFMKLSDELGVNFAFPTQTLQIETFPEKKGLNSDYTGDKNLYKSQIESFVKEWAKGDFAINHFDVDPNAQLRDEG